MGAVASHFGLMAVLSQAASPLEPRTQCTGSTQWWRRVECLRLEVWLGVDASGTLVLTGDQKLLTLTVLPIHCRLTHDNSRPFKIIMYCFLLSIRITPSFLLHIGRSHHEFTGPFYFKLSTTFDIATAFSSPNLPLTICSPTGIPFTKSISSMQSSENSIAETHPKYSHCS